MDEAEFWNRLMFVVSGELAGIEECRRHGLWCDGFLADPYSMDGGLLSIEGRVWIAQGSRAMEEWHFTLLLDREPSRTEPIDWSALLPPEDATGWLSVDVVAKRLVMEPGTAIPDDDVVKQGSWLYGDTVRRAVRIVRQEVWYGTGDHEDPPDVREDREVECFAVLFETALGAEPSYVGGGQFESVDAAVRHVEEVLALPVAWSR